MFLFSPPVSYVIMQHKVGLFKSHVTSHCRTALTLRLAERLRRWQWPVLSNFRRNMNGVMITVNSYLGDPKSMSWNDLEISVHKSQFWTVSTQTWMWCPLIVFWNYNCNHKTNFKRIQNNIRRSFSERIKDVWCWPPVIPFRAAQLNQMTKVQELNNARKLELWNLAKCTGQAAESGGRVGRQVPNLPWLWT
jgi:hypothetical protein